MLPAIQLAEHAVTLQSDNETSRDAIADLLSAHAPNAVRLEVLGPPKPTVYVQPALGLPLQRASPAEDMAVCRLLHAARAEFEHEKGAVR